MSELSFRFRGYLFGRGKNDFYELWQHHKQLKTMEMCEAWHDTYNEEYLNLLALCERILYDSIDSANFSLIDYLLLIRNDFIIHMHGLAVYVKEGLPFAWDLSQESSANYDLSFRLALLHTMSYFFFLYQPPLLSLCMIFKSVLSNKTRFSWSIHLLMRFSLETLPSIIRTG